MYVIVKDFNVGQLTHDIVFDNLKNGGMKLMCYDTQYSWLPNNKIEAIHIGKNDQLVCKVLDFNYPNEWTMFHETSKYKCLPYGPWYFGYITIINK